MTNELLNAQFPRTNQRTISSNGIRNYNIENFTFDKGQGGTLTLGGMNNTNGSLSVKDSSGNTIITLDNTGETINNGKLTIKDNTGTTIIDGTGLVSSSNFSTNSLDVSDQSGSVFTNSSFSDVVSVPSSLSLTLSRVTYVAFFYNIQIAVAQVNNVLDMSARVIFQVYEDGLVGPQILLDSSFIVASGARENVIRKTYAASFVKLITNGTHTIKLQSQLSSGSNAQYTYYGGSLFYLVLGS